MIRRLLLIPALLVLLGLSACSGQVITRVTPTPSLTPTLALAQAATPRPTATPAPYTPAPTATPTVTPTPVVYQVQPGDSLLGIATQFGSTVNMLQEANGIADPRDLQVGQELIVPHVAQEDAEQPAGPSPTPLPFTVENVTFSQTPLGGLWCLGEVHNTSGERLEQVSVEVELLDRNRKPLAQVQTQPFLDLVPADGRAPFAVQIPDPPATFDTYTVRPAGAVRGFVGNYYVDLAVKDTKGAGERYAAYTITGKVANVGPEDAVDVRLTITLYDALGHVVGTRRAAPDHNVVPRGGESSFTLQVTPSGGPVASFRVDPLGRRVPAPTPG